MREALLCHVAIPCTQEVLDLLHILPIPHDNYTSVGETAKDCGLFIYRTKLDIEHLSITDWVLKGDEILNVLTLYATKDLVGICTYLNSIPDRPFNVFTNRSLYNP